MKIGMVTGEYPPMQGGVGAYTCELSRALSDLGHHVYVFSREAAQSPDDDIPLEAAVSSRWGFDTLARVSEWAKRHGLDIVNIQFQTAAYDMHPAQCGDFSRSASTLPLSKGWPPTPVDCAPTSRRSQWCDRNGACRRG